MSICRAAIIGALFTSALLYSQTDPQLEPVKTSITVTGTRTATELEQTPVSTSLVTRDELQERGINQVDQVLSYTEGVTAYRTRGLADNDFGIGMRGFSGRGGQSRTLILLDGQPMNDSYTGTVNWALIPVSELERVEVVRGPFSSLYGGNAMGGVVNLITRPVEKRELEASAQYGGQSTTTYSLRGAARFFDRLGLSTGYQRFQTNGYLACPVMKTATTGNAAAMPVTGVRPWTTASGGVSYQVGMRGEEWFNQNGLRARAEYNFTPKTFATVQYFRQSRGSGYDAFASNLRDAQGQAVNAGLVSFADGGVTRYLSVAQADFLGTPTASRVEIYQAQLLSAPSAHWNLRLMAGLNRTPSEWYITPASTATLSGGNGNFTNQATRAVYGSAQAGWTFRHRHQILFGADTRRDQASIGVTGLPLYTSRENAGPLQSQARGQSMNQSAFVQDQFSFRDKLSVVIGGRYDYWHSFDGMNQRSATAPVLSFPERTTHALTGKLAAAWQAPAELQIRASLGTAFRNPTIYEMYRDLPIGSSLYLANPNADPEHLLSWEAGVQRRLGIAQVDAAYYENRVRDLLYRTTDYATDPTGRTRRLTNAGMALTRGAEFSVREHVRSWIDLKQSYTWTAAEITENPALPETVGKRIPFVPRHMTTFTALASRGRFSGTLAGRYQSAVFSTDVNSDVVRGVPGGYSPFFTADASAGVRVHSHLTVTASVFNLLDRQYYLGTFMVAGRQAFVGLRFRI
jgi:iron complex outermembrane receptor protein